MKVEIDRSKCSGMGLCEVTAPAVFEVGEDGQTHLLVDEIGGDDLALVEEAVSNCPAMALSLQR